MRSLLLAGELIGWDVVSVLAVGGLIFIFLKWDID